MIIRSPVVTYGMSLAAVAAAVGGRLLLDPVVGDRFPFVTLFLAVGFAAWCGGRGPGLLALATSTVAAGVFILQPAFSFAVDQFAYQVGLVLYALAGLGAIAMFESLRQAKQGAETKQRQLEQEVMARQAAEQVLADREELLRTMLVSIGGAVLTTDAGGNVTYLNAVAQQLTGWTQDEACGKPLDMVFRILHEETRQPVENRIMRALKQGTDVGLANDTVLISKDGAERAINDSAAPIRDKDGAVSGAVLVFREVTEQRRALREQEQTLATLNNLVASAPMGIAILDAEMRYLHVNGPLAEINGIPAEDHIGKTISEIAPDLHPQVARVSRRALAEKQTISNEIILEGERAKAPGVKRALRENWFVVPDPEGKPSRVGVIVQEITEERQSEERLRRRNERVRLLSETAAVLLLAKDPNAMLPSLFAKIRPHLGLDVYFHFMVDERGEALQLASRSGIPEATARSLLTRLEFGQAISGMAALSRQSIVVTHIQESDEPVNQVLRSLGIRSYVCNPLMAGDKLLGVLSFGSRSRDMFEADELEFLRTIGRYVSFAYERARLIQQLSEADRRKDEFLAMLAHELRNPLAPIRNSLELMKRASGNDELIEQARSTMERQIKQMVRLVDDLLDVSRITHNKLELKKEQVELASIVHHAVGTCRPDCVRAGHELNVTLPPEPIYLQADPVRLAQVFGNLLSNSCKYMEPGGRMWLTAERQGSEVAVTIKDTGFGIPQEMLLKVFELFTQVDRSSEWSGGGLGIGLSLVQRLVEMHSGTVTAHSEGLGQGSEFIVRLPVLEKREAQPLPEPTVEQTALPARRILVVDDNRDSADSLAMLLGLTGNTTRTAHDGIEAIEQAAAFRPEVILLDIGMPKMNGYDVCRAIREQPWGKHIVMVALTGWGQDEDRRKSKEAGFDEHLVKPADHAALTDLLASLSPGEKRQLTNA